MNTAEHKQVYFNKPQRLTQLIAANTTVIVAGRCTCKTDSIAAPFDYNANINWIIAGQPRDHRFNIIKSFYVKFERRGWRVEAVYFGTPMRHDEKYLLINAGFGGKQRLMPFFNRSNNEYHILAIHSAGVSNGRNGFRKDKSGEKLAESEECLLEHRTDAFDTPYIGAEKFPYHDTFALSVSGIS